MNDGLISTSIPVNIHHLIRLYSRITPVTPSIQCEHYATKLHKQRVLNRFGIGSIHQSNPTHPKPKSKPKSKSKSKSKSKPKSNPKCKQSISSNHLRTPHKPSTITSKKPKPNRNFYHKKKPHRIIPKTPSRSHHNHSHSLDNPRDNYDYTITPLPKINTASIHRKRSHSFSVSRTYNEHSNQNNSKAYTNRLPTHYSPSITHYTPSVDLNDVIHTPEITPPPMQHLPPSRESIHKKIHKHIRKRSRSLSHNDSYSHTHTQSHVNLKNNDKKNENDMNIVHILKLSDIENEKEIKQQEYKKKDNVSEIQINNGKSLLFSSWFSYHKNDDESDEIDIDNVINTIDNIHSSIDSHDNTETIDKIVSPKVGIIKETQSNPTFTTGLKPPRTYNTEREDGNGNTKEDLISFRDFLAQENRKALQREIVNRDNQKIINNNNNNNNNNNSSQSLKNESCIIDDNIDKFYILAGNTIKVDYGLPEGPYTLYKFIITYNHKYIRQTKPIKPAKSVETGINLEYDESPSKKTSHWSIRKRYSDFVTFNNNLIVEIKEMTKMSKTIKLPKLPPKTFKKNFNESFVSQRHDLLLSYLNKIIGIRELQSSVTLLTFLGTINNHTLPYNDKFLDSRMTLPVYISNYADTGDVLLFETKSYIAASLRSVTSSNYDHVALVYRDIHGTHQCSGIIGDNDNDKKYKYNGRLYLIESTVDGVRTYPLKLRLKQWSLLCPQIVVRRLKLLKPGIQDAKMHMNKEWASSSLNSIKKYDETYTKFDYAQKTEKFYNLSKEFIDKVNGSDYAIWSNVFRLSDVPFEKQKSFFCSQLVTAFFKFMYLLPSNVKTNRILPGHFSDDLSNKIKLPMKNCLLLQENLLLFSLPNINNAKHTNKPNNHHIYNR